jgi:hypothetical protein
MVAVMTAGTGAGVAAAAAVLFRRVLLILVTVNMIIFIDECARDCQ